MKPGKRTLEWNRVRAKLKQQHEASGITRCEMCGSGSFLGFAHRLKRRKIPTGDPELSVAALLCVTCHESLEYGPPETMYNAITKIIKARR